MPSAPDYFLQTSRLAFRAWTSDDLPLARALWGDPDVTRFFGGTFPEAQIQQRLASEIANLLAYRVQYWPLFSLADGHFVGCCGLRPYKPEEKIFELGFHLRPAYWGKGLAKESASTVIAHAFTALDVSVLFAGHHPENLASQKVLRGLGFCFTHEELYPPTGEMHLCYRLNRPR